MFSYRLYTRNVSILRMDLSDKLVFLIVLILAALFEDTDGAPWSEKESFLKP